MSGAEPVQHVQCAENHTYHVGGWPISGEITIEKCERQCRLRPCKARSKSAAALRKHVRKHIEHNELGLRIRPGSNGRPILRISRKIDLYSVPDCNSQRIAGLPAGLAGDEENDLTSNGTMREFGPRLPEIVNLNSVPQVVIPRRLSQPSAPAFQRVKSSQDAIQLPTVSSMLTASESRMTKKLCSCLKCSGSIKESSSWSQIEDHMKDKCVDTHASGVSDQLPTQNTGSGQGIREVVSPAVKQIKGKSGYVRSFPAPEPSLRNDSYASRGLSESKSSPVESFCNCSNPVLTPLCHFRHRQPALLGSSSRTLSEEIHRTPFMGYIVNSQSAAAGMSWEEYRAGCP